MTLSQSASGLGSDAYEEAAFTAVFRIIRVRVKNPAGKRIRRWPWRGMRHWHATLVQERITRFPAGVRTRLGESLQP